jgi:hypothetical protein
MVYEEKSTNGRMHTKLYLESWWLRIEFPNNISLKVFSVKFLKENMSTREGADTDGLHEGRAFIYFGEGLQRETACIELQSPW